MNENVIFESPLKWLPQQPRTKNPERARFGTHSISSTGNRLAHELELLGAKSIVITSNLKSRQRGDGFLANQTVSDAGIVVYFELKGQGKAMACDKWDKPEHNLRALELNISAIRGMERWGGSDFLDGLFGGFKALPAPEPFHLITPAPAYFADAFSLEDVKQRYRNLAKELHPDNGGNDTDFAELNRQYVWALKQAEKIFMK